MGSAMELDYHLLLARDLGFLAPDAYAALFGQVTTVKKMLNAFMQRLAASSS